MMNVHCATPERHTLETPAAVKRVFVKPVAEPLTTGITDHRDYKRGQMKCQETGPFTWQVIKRSLSRRPLMWLP